MCIHHYYNICIQQAFKLYSWQKYNTIAIHTQLVITSDTVLVWPFIGNHPLFGSRVRNVWKGTLVGKEAWERNEKLNITYTCGHPFGAANWYSFNVNHQYIHWLESRIMESTGGDICWGNTFNCKFLLIIEFHLQPLYMAKLNVIKCMYGTPQTLHVLSYLNLTHVTVICGPCSDFKKQVDANSIVNSSCSLPTDDLRTTSNFISAHIYKLYGTQL